MLYECRLLQVLSSAADHDRVDIYLETTGEGNIGFYTKKAEFEEKERIAITEPLNNQTYDDDGGMAFMVRAPRCKNVLGDPIDRQQ